MSMPVLKRMIMVMIMVMIMLMAGFVGVRPTPIVLFHARYLT